MSIASSVDYSASPLYTKSVRPDVAEPIYDKPIEVSHNRVILGCLLTYCPTCCLKSIRCLLFYMGKRT